MSKKNISPEPGIRIRSLRDKLKLSRKRFEAITGFKANTLRHLETGSQPLQATAARLLSNLFIYRFEIDFDKASEHFLLHGKQEDELAKE